MSKIKKRLSATQKENNEEIKLDNKEEDVFKLQIREEDEVKAGDKA